MFFFLTVFRTKFDASSLIFVPEISVLLASYAGASVLFSPIAGLIADRLSSRRTPFLGGLLFIILATAILWAGTSMPVLIIGRILQGLSGAVVWTVGLALVMDTVGSENLGKTIGTVGDEVWLVSDLSYVISCSQIFSISELSHVISSKRVRRTRLMRCLFKSPLVIWLLPSSLVSYIKQRECCAQRTPSDNRMLKILHA